MATDRSQSVRDAAKAIVLAEWAKRGDHKTCARCGGKYGGIWDGRKVCGCKWYYTAKKGGAR